MRLWRDTETAQFWNASRSTIWRWARAGLIPAPITIGGAARFIAESQEARAAELAAAPAGVPAPDEAPRPTLARRGRPRRAAREPAAA